MNPSDKVCDIVTENFRTSVVFKSVGIDFCCNGQITVEDACKKKKVDLNRLMSKLNEANCVRPSEDVKSWSTDLIINYLVSTHHKYLKETLPVLETYLAKVAKVHGAHTPSLIEVYETFLELKNELLPHLDEEENILFKHFDAVEKGGSAEEDIEKMLKLTADDHRSVGEKLEKLNRLTDGFNPPEHACNTWRVSFQYLHELEEDTHKHIHIENNILFPRFQHEEV